MMKCQVTLKLTQVEWQEEGFSSLEEWSKDYMTKKLNCYLSTPDTDDPTPYLSALIAGKDVLNCNGIFYRFEVVSEKGIAIPWVNVNKMEKSDKEILVCGEFYTSENDDVRRFLECVRLAVCLDQYNE